MFDERNKFIIVNICAVWFLLIGLICYESGCSGNDVFLCTPYDKTDGVVEGYKIDHDNCSGRESIRSSCYSGSLALRHVSSNMSSSSFLCFLMVEENYSDLNQLNLRMQLYPLGSTISGIYKHFSSDRCVADVTPGFNSMSFTGTMFFILAAFVFVGGWVCYPKSGCECVLVTSRAICASLGILSSRSRVHQEEQVDAYLGALEDGVEGKEVCVTESESDSVSL